MADEPIDWGVVEFKFREVTSSHEDYMSLKAATKNWPGHLHGLKVRSRVVPYLHLAPLGFFVIRSDM